MKSFFYLVALLLSCFLLPARLHAQVPNGDFELSLNPDSSLQHWFNMTNFSVGFQDSFLEDGPLLSRSTQAHSGSYALELRNSYNITQDIANNGSAICVESPVPSFSRSFPISNQPQQLRFFYHIYANPHGDATFCQVRILNADYAEIGLGSVTLSAQTSAYQQQIVPVQYFVNPVSSGDSIPRYAELTFKNETAATGPHVGYRILIDDISLAAPTSIGNGLSKEQNTQYYPNPARDLLYIKGRNILSIALFDVSGRRVCLQQHTKPIPVKELSPGTYWLQIDHPDGIEIKKVIRH